MKEHKIGWLNIPGYIPETWNPIIGCTKISEGCKNCFAERMAVRLANIGKTSYYQAVTCSGPHTTPSQWNGKTYLATNQLSKPFGWKNPRAIFVCDMGDLFHESAPFEWIDRVFEIMDDCMDHIFILLTKRPERMYDYIDYRIKTGKSYGHSWVWLGVTAENQEQANKRIPVLLQIPAAKHIVSIEPILSQVDLKEVDENHLQNYLTGMFHCEGVNEPCLANKLDWVIVGGETGPGARPIHPDWVRSVRDQCQQAGTPFFFKQWGEWSTRWIKMGTDEPVFKMFDSFEQWRQKDWVHKGDACISIDGKWCKTGGDLKTAQYPVAIMQKVGRKASGNLLDGQQYHNWPKNYK